MVQNWNKGSAFTYLVGKNEEDSKVFEHRTLGDHLQV